MKRTVFILFVLFLGAKFSFSQNGIGNDFMFQYGTGSTMRLSELPVKKGETVGSYYIDEEWHNANIELTTDEIIENYQVKINIKDKNIEIQTEEEILLLDLAKVANLEWENNGIIESFTNFSSSVNGAELGFTQILYNGDTKLFSKPTLVLLPANYNTAVAAGSNYDKYVIEKKLYLFKNNSLVLVKNNKSSVLKALSDKEEAIKTYIKVNKIKFKELSDLVLVLDYYNQI
jgi:hypothetical protein